SGDIAASSGAIPGRSSRPANRGEFVSIYCTGIGAVSNQPQTGSAALVDPLSAATAVPVVRIGGVASTPNFTGLAPGFVGLYQVNVQVPLNAPTGNVVSVQIVVGGVNSNQATIAVQ